MGVLDQNICEISERDDALVHLIVGMGADEEREVSEKGTLGTREKQKREGEKHGHETFCSRADINDPPGDPCSGKHSVWSDVHASQSIQGSTAGQLSLRHFSLSTRSCWVQETSGARPRSRAACSCHWVLTACIEILAPAMRPPQPRAPTPLFISCSLSHCPRPPSRCSASPSKGGKCFVATHNYIRARKCRPRMMEKTSRPASYPFPLLVPSSRGLLLPDEQQRTPSTPRSCGSTLDDRLAGPTSCCATGAEGASGVWLPSGKGRVI